MIDPLGFDTERLDALVSRMRDAADHIQTELDTLDRETATLRGEWSGEARRAYDIAQQRWAAEMTQLRGILHDSAGAAEHAAHHYRHAEKAALAIWN